MKFEHFGFKFSDDISSAELALVLDSFDRSTAERAVVLQKYRECGKVLIADERLVSKHKSSDIPLRIHFFNTKTYQRSSIGNFNHPNQLLTVQTASVLTDYYLRVRNYPYVEWWYVHRSGKMVDENNTFQQCSVNWQVLSMAKISGPVTEQAVMNFRGWEIQETADLGEDYSMTTFRIYRVPYLAAHPNKPAILTWFGV
ncbi:MAG: hypothetical protein QME78_11245 [Thermodesulfobacteriota bacterium]|nr:hypothetical protein [Thermodesulfobacteriota bacterium]